MEQYALSYKQDIFQCPLCSSVPKDQRESFLDDVKFRIKKFSKGNIIITQESLYNELFILTQGEVKTGMIDEKGDFMPVGDIKAPNPLAIGFLFAQHNYSPVTVIAVSECSIITIPKENVYVLMRKYDTFMMSFLSNISDKIAFMSERLRMVSLRTIKAKLAYYLLKESKGEDSFILKSSKENIARLLGVSRPALVSVMMQMAADNLISVNQRQIEIIERGSLQNML
ncbi:MAG: Crp/Fnr family transcriptional regulator [Paludibacteraceae bacterium]